MTAVPIDDIVPVLNPVRSADLTVILRLTPARVRPDVALAYAELSVRKWNHLAGLYEDGGVSLGRWLRQENRIPFGAAYRLARVLDVNVEILFAAFA